MYFFYFNYFNLVYGKFRDLQYVTEFKKKLRERKSGSEKGLANQPEATKWKQWT